MAEGDNIINNNIIYNYILPYYYDRYGDYAEEKKINNLQKVAPLVQKRVADIMIHVAIQNKETCPISMEYIDSESICVSPCYHCFQAEAIHYWLSKNPSCPVCREICTTDRAK